MQKTSGAHRWALWLLSVLIWTVSAILTVFFWFIMLLWAVPALVLDPQKRISHTLASMWGRALMRCHAGWRVAVVGRHYLHPTRTYILVANHQSLMDITVLYGLHCQFKWVAKQELFHIPFLGWAMSLAGYIRLARGRHGSIRDTYEEARRYLAAGMSVLFFPEGTRSQTPTMLPFKNGAFKVALAMGVPVVPIAVRGTRNLLPRNSLLINPAGTITVTVLPPVDLRAYGLDEADRLRDDVRGLIEQALAR